MWLLSSGIINLVTENPPSEDMNENCETMNMKITKDLLNPESFGMKLDQDEKEFIGRLLSFDRSSS